MSEQVSGQEFQTVSRGKSQRQRTENQNENRSYRDLLNELTNLKKYQFSPKVELIDREDHFIIKVEVSGINNNISIQLQDSQFLFISMFKYDNNYDIQKVYSECRYGKINRRVKLPSLVEEDVNYTYVNGVLTITVWKMVEKIDPNLKLEKEPEKNKETDKEIDEISKKLYSSLVSGTDTSENDKKNNTKEEKLGNIDFNDLKKSWADDY